MIRSRWFWPWWTLAASLLAVACLTSCSLQSQVGKAINQHKAAFPAYLAACSPVEPPNTMDRCLVWQKALQRLKAAIVAIADPDTGVLLNGSAAPDQRRELADASKALRAAQKEAKP